MENSDFTTSITSLPDEIVSLILSYSEPPDIVRFSVTCKKFYELVFNNYYLWKIKYSEIMPKEMIKLVEERCNSNWLREVNQFYELRRKIHFELVSMSPKFYWAVNGVSLGDVRIFFTFAAESNTSFYYTINILQDIVKKGNIFLDNFTIFKPLYTLTVIYYTKIVLRYLVQTYLAIKWVKLHVNRMLPPEVIITFFLQWVDPTNIYSDEEVERKIQSLAFKVKKNLDESHASENKENKIVKYTDKEVLFAISHAIYKHINFSVDPHVKTNTLNIAKVIDESNGNIITYAVIFQAVARKFGVRCAIIIFENDIFLEWQNTDKSGEDLSVDLTNGDINPVGPCPYTPNNNTNHDYIPDALLHYIYMSYMDCKGDLTDCKTENASHILDFFDTRDSSYNPYKNFLPFLVGQANTPTMTAPLNIKYITESYLQLILALANLNDLPSEAYKNVIVKEHPDSVYYAVGMICYHKVYNYMCIIRGWEPDGTQLSIHIRGYLQFGLRQPFYRVIAGDQSERYVAQENLKAVTTPFRIHRLEDHIAKEFTHFDGFSYILNNEKIIEYPYEHEVIEVYRERFFKLLYSVR